MTDEAICQNELVSRGTVLLSKRQGRLFFRMSGMKKLSQKGFSLSEFLIVVAIIAVLVAISIPIFNSQLEKSREAVDAANIRAVYAEMMTDQLTGTYGKDDTGAAKTYTVTLKQKKTDWQGADLKTGLEENMKLSGSPKEGGTATLEYDSTKTGKEAVTVNFSS